VSFSAKRVCINLVPVIVVNVMFLPLWITNQYPKDYMLDGYITTAETFYNAVINPLYLVIANMIHSVKHKRKLFVVNILLMALSCLAGILLHYFNWGISTHYSLLIAPDGDTIYMVLVMLLIIPAVITAGVIEQIILLLLYRVRL